MDRMDFIHSVTRTRVLENKLLSRVVIDRMVDAKDIDEVFMILGETDYSEAVSSISKAEDYEEILSAELERFYKLMKEITDDNAVVDLMALKYDYHNLKVLVKEKEMGKDLSDLYVPIGTVDFKKLKVNFLSDTFRLIEPEFKDVLVSVTKDFEEKKDPQRIDLIIDKYYFEHLYSIAKQTDIELFVNYVKDLIDFTNIRTTIRLKRQGGDIKFLEEVLLPHGNIKKSSILLALNDSIDVIIRKFENYRISPELKKGLESYQSTNRLSDLEKYMDNYLMKINKSSKLIAFGPEPIFSYMVAKESEIKTLRIIMVSKLNKLSSDSIRERLRDLYV